MDSEVIPYKWCLWTMWSMNVEDWKKEGTTQDFVDKVIDTVDRHDKKFAQTVFSAVGNRDEIIVIQPQKLRVGWDQLEIVGTIYKPGKDSGGKRWTLIAVDDLKEVLMADSGMISSNGVNDLFIILGGHIQRSGQQILLNETNPSKVIRVISHNSAGPRTESVLGFSVSLFQCPYDNYRGPPGRIQDVIFRLDKRASTTVLKTFPSLPPAETSENSISTTPVKMRKGPSEQSLRPPPTQEALELEYSASPEIEIIYSTLPNDKAGADPITPRPANTDSTGPRVATPPPMTPPIVKDLRVILHRLKIPNLTARTPASKDDNNERLVNSPANSNTTEPRLVSNRPKITTDLSSKTPIPKTSTVDPRASAAKNTTPLSKSKRLRTERDELSTGEDKSPTTDSFPKRRRINFGKQKDNYVYFNLQELEDRLIKENEENETLFSTLEFVNVWAVVISVRITPKETPFSPVQIENSPRAANYILVVSDETKNDVLVRLCTNIRSDARSNVNHLIGPIMKPTDIIRIHRATAQWEEAETGGRVMVISATPHNSYSLFNFDSNVDGPIVVQRLSRKAPELREGPVERVHQLRQFILRGTVETSTLSNDESDSGNSDDVDKNVTIVLGTPTPPNTLDSAIETVENISEGRTGDQVIDNISPFHETEQSQVKRRTLRPRPSSVGLSPGTSSSCGTGEKSGNILNTNDLNENISDSEPDSQFMMPVTFAQRTELLALANSQGEYTVEEVVSCLRYDSLPIKLNKISGDLNHPILLHAKIIDLVETTKDELIVRISDGTRVHAPIKKLIPSSYDVHPDKDSDDPSFVDVLLTNISDSPDVRRRVMAGLGSGKGFLFTFVNVSKVPGSSEVELRVNASSANPCS